MKKTKRGRRPLPDHLRRDKQATMQLTNKEWDQLLAEIDNTDCRSISDYLRATVKDVIA